MSNHRFRRRHRLVVGVGAAVLAGCGSGGGAVVPPTTTTEATTSTVPPETTTTVEVETTTTTEAVQVDEPTPTLPPSSVARSTLPATVGDGPYDGWAIPAYIVRCESDGDYGAENPRSSASGAYQITDGTWDGYGGYDRAVDAPPAVQDAKAAELWAGGRGRAHWQACL